MIEVLVEFNRVTGEVETHALGGDNARRQALAA